VDKELGKGQKVKKKKNRGQHGRSTTAKGMAANKDQFTEVREERRGSGSSCPGMRGPWEKKGRKRLPKLSAEERTDFFDKY